MARIENMMQKRMRRFEETNENVKDMRSDLSGIRQKVDAHVVSINHLELQMTQLSTIVNPRQPGTLSSNTIQNPKNDGHYMAVTSREGKHTIDQPMSSTVEGDMRKKDEVAESSGELGDTTKKEVELLHKVVPVPRPPPPFPPRLEKKMEDGKYCRFIIMLKQFSINIPFIKAL
ncbi:uncharacterized protein LOC107022202 [Solanum pennellii]|uniref:Uncharacterized protein LOC107022202 n=1 Tax=Solanum pennellii TaxID=28526 RepID=A0ABM1GZX8_SOLPN|nr:uncharacterized protein LOC107022202 [Solanum pennellii]